MHAPLNFPVFDAAISKHTATHCISDSELFKMLLIASDLFFSVPFFREVVSQQFRPIAMA